MMHLESVSNGLGAPSLWLMLMAIRGDIPATVSITADTGWEEDRLWNTGRRSSNREYFDEIIVPLCKGSRVTPFFVRAEDKNKNPFPPLSVWVERSVGGGPVSGVPMFGSRGGRDIQTCTDKMKIRACRQHARRLGATTNRNAQGIHFHEADRRVKGLYLNQDGPWSIYQTTIYSKRKKTHKVIKWQTHYYPLVDLKMSRQSVYDNVNREGIPFIISSECDLCPHKDLARWERSSEAVIAEGERIETMFEGQKFFTDRRIPLRQAIVAMQAHRTDNPERYKQEADFGCGNDICGV